MTQTPPAPSTHPTEEIEQVNEEVRVKVHKKPHCRIEFTTLASPFLVKKAKEAALKNVGKDVTLPGFRKGKAPADLLLKKYGPDVEKEYQKQLADLAFTSSQKLTQIPLLNNNSRISYEWKGETSTGAQLLFSFETEPTVPPIEISGFQPKEVHRTPVTEKEIEEAIRQMRFFFAEWQNITERAVQNGDYLMISLETLEGETPQKVFDHVRFEVSKERMAEWMKKMVEGAKAGEVLEGESYPDENASEEEKKAFQRKKIRLTIHKIEEAILPSVDDEFAKKVGANDVSAMREMVTKILNTKADENVKEELQDQVNDYLIQNHPFELPTSLIETEAKDRLRQAQMDPKKKKEWDAMSQKEREHTLHKIAEESAGAIRLFYLSRHIVNDAKIPISQQEVQQEAIQVINQLRGDQKVESIPKEVYAYALSKILLAKAQDYILGKKPRGT